MAASYRSSRLALLANFPLYNPNDIVQNMAAT